MSISSEASKTFLNVFPSLESKAVVMENILSSEFVRQRAGLIPKEEVAKEMPREENVVKLLSVGRFYEAKNYDNVLDICRRINSKLSTLNSQLSEKWHIIVWGGDEALIRQKIEEAGMQEHVIILGKKTNPYPYIKACDIYCQPSRYEGKSVTVREAQVLCKPVVVTNYATAKSQVNDGVDGVIVPMDNESFATEIIQFLKNEDLKEKIIAYMNQFDYANKKGIDIIFKIL